MGACGYVGLLTQAVCASAFHPYVATGGAEGAVKLTNVLGAGRRRAEDGSRVMHPLFRVVRDGEAYAVRHALYPEGVAPRAPSKAAPPTWDTWDASVGVTSVAFAPRAAQARRLASGIACGLVRIESV